jgi:pimeloyl-ACP methyl ester carboxylesterase
MKNLIALSLSSLLVVSAAFSGHAGRVVAQRRSISHHHLLQPNASKLTPPTLPEPSGAYAVGTAISHLTDASRPDTLAKKPGQFRELIFQLWYPTDVAPKGETAPYIPNPALLQALKDEPHDGQAPALIDAWKDIRTAATLDAPLSRKIAKCPLLFFSHGLGESRSTYTAFAQDLASHGYIVVCIDHPYGGITILTDGRVISTGDDPDAGSTEATPRMVEAWARDASFVLDRLASPAKTDGAALERVARHIDLSRVGMLGHSLGGAAALEACRADSRFKACVDLDGAPFGKVTQEGVKRPTLVMRSQPIYSDEDLAKRGRTRAQWEEMGRQGKLMWDSMLPRDKSTPVYTVKPKGTGHMSYSDAPFVMPDTITRFGGRIIDARRGYEIITRYILAFFDKYLDGKPSDLLDGTNSPYPEAPVERVNL